MTKDQYTALFCVQLQGIMAEGLIIANRGEAETRSKMAWIQNAPNLSLRQIADYFFELDMEVPRFEFRSTKTAGRPVNNPEAVPASSPGNQPAGD